MGNKYIIATDPRGLPVEMWDERWEWICLKHQELVKRGVTQGHLADAIENPENGTIYWSNDYRDSDLYFKRFSRKLMLRVAVKYVAGAGEVPTVHFVRRISKNNKIRWMKDK